MNQRFTPQQALPKAMQFCAYQERCHSEVKEKLLGWSLTVPEADEIISRLIQDNYLNEERFAIHYAGGRFRIKQWGKVKIQYHLKGKGVSVYCIKKALASIDLDDYYRTLEHLAQQKMATLSKEKNSFIKRKKLRDFLLAKGYESSLIQEQIKQWLG